MRSEYIDVQCRVACIDVFADSRKGDSEGLRCLEVAVAERVVLRGIGRSDHDESGSRRDGAEHSESVEEFEVALLSHEPTDRTDQDVVGTGPELGADLNDAFGGTCAEERNG